MPILPAESDLYPERLWDLLSQGGLSSSNGDPYRWWCLHTKPRQEKKTARYLLGRKLFYYLPQSVKTSRTQKGRKITSILPLFPGYVFFYGTERDRLFALESNTIVSMLQVVDQEELVKDLQQIERLLKSGMPILKEPSYPIGSLVEIQEGPLRGFTGLVYKRGKGHRFMAVVRMLGQGVSVALEDWQVAEAPPPSPEGWQAGDEES